MSTAVRHATFTSARISFLSMSITFSLLLRSSVSSFRPENAKTGRTSSHVTHILLASSYQSEGNDDVT